MNNFSRFCLISVIAIFVILTIIPSYAQQSPRRNPMPKGSIKGFVYDAKNSKPVEYANVVLYRRRTNEQATGTITDSNGFFSLTDLQVGLYLLEIKFIGFKAFTIDSLRIRPNQIELDLGRIEITPDVLAMGSVEVLGEKPIIEFQIDKKVINVSKQFTSISGTAVDVLENVPSVSVDIEGNVSLRGSDSFTLLIDGRPSILDANDALQTIPASTIENIEIVTNPSAKYDPDGVAGIINVITKKHKQSGVTGLININAGNYGSYGGDFLLSWKRSHTNIYFGADYNKRIMPGSMHSESWTSINNDTSYINAGGNVEWGGPSGGFRGGIDIDLTPADLLRFSVRYGSRHRNRDFERDYKQWSSQDDSTTYYTSISNFSRGGDYYSINLDYRHTFPKEGHEISSQINFDKREGDEESLNELLDELGSKTSGQISTESGPRTRSEFKVDYVLPVNEDDRIEAGYQSRYMLSDDKNSMSNWNAQSNTYVLQDSFSHTTDYTDLIQSSYLIYAGNVSSLEFQVGLRGEYTYRLIKLIGEDEEFTIDRWNIYPTFHTSYQMSNGQQLMASYTRRIYRARGWQLEPFLTWMDAYNVRRGNPGLKPQYIDSYEAGYQKTIGKSLLSLEAYYRVTHNKVERIRTVYEKDIFLMTFENVGQDYALGTELMLALFPTKWWNLNIMGNIYDYRVEGNLYGQSFDEGSFNWSTRVNNTFRLGRSTRIQLSGIYRSPSVNAQGRTEGNFFTNAAIKQDFYDRKLSATIQLMDIFGTGRREFTSEGPGFYSNFEMQRATRMISLTLTYNINNYKNDRDRKNGENDMDFDEGDTVF